MIGPETTAGLEALLDETAERAAESGSVSPFLFHAYGATGEYATLQAARGRDLDTVHERLARSGVQLLRTIGGDDRLADALLDELQRRGVDLSPECSRHPHATQQIALITEWDTSYGRYWPEALLRKIRARDRCGSDRDPLRDPAAVERSLLQFSYLRGLDGEAAVASKAAGAASAKDGGARPDAAAAAGDRNRARLIERAEGQTQLDYLRRLSARIRTIDAGQRRLGGDGVRAIGVLGTDVYDKLLVLQALHKEFPAVVFFTTDLDARMLHPQEQAWARNLVVASNFGLELSRSLQQNIPPFRDGYQTSIYLSTLVALNNAAYRCVAGSRDGRCVSQQTIDGWLRHPRVFEIGRTLAFDYSTDRTAECNPAGLGRCPAIHPDPSLPFTTPSTHALRQGFLVIVGGLALLALALGYGHRWWPVGAKQRIRRGAVAAATIVLIGVATMQIDAWWSRAGDYLTESGQGEPLVLAEGISIWPTQLMRLFACLFSVCFVFWAWRLLDRNLAATSRELRFQPQYAELVDATKAEYRKAFRDGSLQWWRVVLRAFSFRLEEATGRSGACARDAHYFWTKYIFQGHIGARLCRVTAAVVVYWLVCATVIQFFGSLATPFRGTVSLHWNLTSLVLSVTAMLFVIFFVVDATVFCYQLISALQEDIVPLAGQRRLVDRDADPAAACASPPASGADARDVPAQGGPGSLWADSTLAHYESKFGLKPQYLDAWILMDFITLRTKVVAKLVYFPFIVISVMVLSRSSFFDNWNMPTGLAIVFTASVLIVAVCAILLRVVAERARSGAIERLSDDLIRLKGGDDTDRRAVPQLEQMIARIRSLREGAFAPYSQQPFLRAALLPLSTFGGTALLDFLAAGSF